MEHCFVVYETPKSQTVNAGSISYTRKQMLTQQHLSPKILKNKSKLPFASFSHIILSGIFNLLDEIR